MEIHAIFLELFHAKRDVELFGVGSADMVKNSFITIDSKSWCFFPEIDKNHAVFMLSCHFHSKSLFFMFFLFMFLMPIDIPTGPSVVSYRAISRKFKIARWTNYGSSQLSVFGLLAEIKTLYFECIFSHPYWVSRGIDLVIHLMFGLPVDTTRL